jgi:hypothetical protein
VGRADVLREIESRLMTSIGDHLAASLVAARPLGDSVNLAQRVLLEKVAPDRLAKHRLAEGMATVLVTPRFPTSRHVVAMIFPPGRADAELVVKIPRRLGDTVAVVWKEKRRYLTPEPY